MKSQNKTMKAYFELLWPYLGPEAIETKRKREQEAEGDIEEIRNAGWANSDHLLEEARNLVALENERRRGAESKASIYLAVVAAIIPVLSSLVTDFYGDGFTTISTSFQIITLLLFFLGLMYLLASAGWAFRTLAVSVHHRVDPNDLVAISREPNPTDALIRELLIATRSNRDGVNQKVTCIRMAHQFLLRTLFSFAVLVAVIVLREPGQALGKTMLSWGQ